MANEESTPQAGQERDTGSGEHRRVFLLGGTGTIGRATASALCDAGYDVTALVRPGSDRDELAASLPGVRLRFGDVADPGSLESDGFRGETFDLLVSCLASRTGHPKDAWRIDYEAHCHALTAARTAGVRQVVLVSAICVQKPRLAFQKAKLAFEDELRSSGLTYSIIRPTAFFKSLSGQIERVRGGKPFLLFGKGAETACKPISDEDLAAFIVTCIENEEYHDRTLPIGGPGPAITPKEQGLELFRLIGTKPRFRSVPPGMFRLAAGVLGAGGKLIPALEDKAEFARIAHYYGTESMLVWDQDRETYDEAKTPSFGSRTLFDHYCEVVEGRTKAGSLGDHAMFEKATVRRP